MKRNKLDDKTMRLIKTEFEELKECLITTDDDILEELEFCVINRVFDYCYATMEHLKYTPITGYKPVSDFIEMTAVKIGARFENLINVKENDLSLSDYLNETIDKIIEIVLNAHNFVIDMEGIEFPISIVNKNIEVTRTKYGWIYKYN